jgi:long-chain fatty acid transport protein
MAGAQTAKADDASAVFYNPAGIALRPGGGAMAGVTIASGGFTSRTASPGAVNTSTERGTFVLPIVYASAHLGRRFALGMGAFTQFGAGVKWNAKGRTVDPNSGAVVEVPFPGRFASQSTQLKTVTLNPTVAVRPHDQVAFGAGVAVVIGSTEFERALQLADVEGRARFGGSATGVGWNLGVLVDLVPGRFSMGLAWRSAVTLDFDLKAHFDAPPELRDRVFDQKATSRLVLPHGLTLGVATFPTDRLTITTDLHYTLWSSLRELAVDFPSGKTPSLSAPQEWRDTWSLRVGGEYKVWGRVALRLGAGWDPSPVPSHTLGPTSPVGDRALVSAGLGVTFRGFGIDAGWLGSFGRDRTALPSERGDPGMTFGGSLHLITIAARYAWGR